MPSLARCCSAAVRRGRPQALGDDGALQEHVVAVLGDLAGDYLVRQGVDLLIVSSLVGESGDLGEHVAADVVDDAVYASHIASSLCSIRGLFATLYYTAKPHDCK